MFDITLLFAIILASLYLVLSFRVIFGRIRYKVNLGVTDSTVGLTKRVRAHSNFIEYVPFALLLMLLFEMKGGNTILLYSIGGLLTLGRILHIFGIDGEKPKMILRQFGMICTFTTYIMLIVSLTLLYFQNL